MSERPTPMTDDHVNELRRNPEVSGCGRTLEFARNLERQLAEAREEIGRIRKFATVNGVSELERQLADLQLENQSARVALSRYGAAFAAETLSGSIVRVMEVVDAYRSKMYDLESQLADALAQLRIADEQLALERAALAEVSEMLNAFEYEPDEDSCMGMSFFGARLCEDSFFHLKWKLEEILKSPVNTRSHPPQVG